MAVCGFMQISQMNRGRALQELCIEQQIQGRVGPGRGWQPGGDRWGKRQGDEKKREGWGAEKHTKSTLRVKNIKNFQWGWTRRAISPGKLPATRITANTLSQGMKRRLPIAPIC